MKKLCILFLTIVLIFASGCSEESNSSAEVKSTKAEKITVYITETGECYHTEDCICLHSSKIKMSLEDACKEYRACKLCYPPVI